MNQFRKMADTAKDMIRSNDRVLTMLRSTMTARAASQLPPAIPVHTAQARIPGPAPAVRRAAREGAAQPALRSGHKGQPLTEKPSSGIQTPPAGSTKRSKELEALLNPSNYSASGISAKDLNRIIGLYGSSVENIYELGAGQRWMLEEGKNVSNAFFLQILTKAVIQFDPPAFRQRADEVCRKHENLRSSFVIKDMETPYRVLLKDRRPEINCFDLSDLDMETFDDKIRKLMETDRQRGFDLEKDPLLRISVYKSCEKDTYAIIVSQPHMNSDGTSLGILFADLFIGYALDLNGIDKKVEAQSYDSYARHLQHVDTDKELAYWKETLSGSDEDQLLPGQQVTDLDCDIATYFVPFEEEELDTLQKAQKNFAVTRFTILQGLWGVMTARLRKREDMVFGAITAGRDAEVSESMVLNGGFVNAIPVRVHCPQDMQLNVFFRSLQMELAHNMENSHCSPGQIKEALGRTKPVFSHILNSHNFASHKGGSGFASGGFSGIRIIGGDVYDNLSTDLCVYFTTNDGRRGCQYSYNSRAFSREVIQLLAENFQAMISALKDCPEGMTVGALPWPDVSLFHTVENTKRIEQIKIASRLKKHPVFQNVSEQELLSLASCCRTEYYSEGEIIVHKDKLLDELPILLHGRAILYGETTDGWCNPLFVKNQGSILSFSPIFDQERTQNMVINSSDDIAVVLFLPQKTLLEFFSLHPESIRTVAKLLYQERSVFVRLWTKAT